MPTSYNPIIAAHRGNAFHYPENSLIAFQSAWDNKIPYIELDTRFSKDGVAVVIHDQKLKRLTGVDQNVSELDIDELMHLDIGQWKDPRFKGQSIPSLERILSKAPKGTKVLVESKAGCNDLLIKLGKQFHDKVEFMDFDFEVVSYIKSKLPHIPVHLLLDDKPQDIEKVISKALSVNLDGINPCYKIITPDLANAIKTANLKLRVFRKFSG